MSTVEHQRTITPVQANPRIGNGCNLAHDFGGFAYLPIGTVAPANHRAKQRRVKKLEIAIDNRLAQRTGDNARLGFQTLFIRIGKKLPRFRQNQKAACENNEPQHVETDKARQQSAAALGALTLARRHDALYL